MKKGPLLGELHAIKKKACKACQTGPLGTQIFSNIFPVHDRAARSISPSVATVWPT